MFQDRQGIPASFTVHRRFADSLLSAQRKEAALLPSACSGITYTYIYIYIYTRRVSAPFFFLAFTGLTRLPLFLSSFSSLLRLSSLARKLQRPPRASFLATALQSCALRPTLCIAAAATILPHCIRQSSFVFRFANTAATETQRSTIGRIKRSYWLRTTPVMAFIILSFL